MDNTGIKKFYDFVAEETSKSWDNNEILLPTIKDFISFLPVHPRILDLGCRPGHESKRLFNEGTDVTGIKLRKQPYKL